MSKFFAPTKKPDLEALAAARASRAIFCVPSEPRDAVLPRLYAHTPVMRWM